MTAISQMTFSNDFYEYEVLYFDSNFNTVSSYGPIGIMPAFA